MDTNRHKWGIVREAEEVPKGNIQRSTFNIQGSPGRAGGWRCAGMVGAVWSSRREVGADSRRLLQVKGADATPIQVIRVNPT